MSDKDVIPFKILIVEHDDKVRQGIKNDLDQKGFIVEVEKSSVNTARKAEEFQPELLLVGLEMPRLDGTILIRKFRKDEDFEKTPIIALANRLDKETVLTLKNLAVTDVILKPVNTSKLLESIEKYYRVKVIAEMAKID